jgi:hypothetical protein
MILVWSGRGYVVPASTFLASLATEVLTEATLEDDRYYQNTPGRSQLPLPSEESCPTSSARQGSKARAILSPSQAWHPQSLPVRDTVSSGSGLSTGGLA